MAKHRPKKKKAPDPEPKDSESSETPPTESTSPEPTKPTKPTGPAMSDAEIERANSKLKKLFWFRVGLAVAAGISATFIFEPLWGEERRWASIAYMIILFIISVIVAKAMRMRLPSDKRKKIVTEGIGSYIFMYLFAWILSYTVVNLPSDGSGIASPFP